MPYGKLEVPVTTELIYLRRNGEVLYEYEWLDDFIEMLLERQPVAYLTTREMNEGYFQHRVYILPRGIAIWSNYVSKTQEKRDEEIITYILII